MAIRAWMDCDLRLALRLLQWAQPELTHNALSNSAADSAIKDQDDSDWAFQAA